MIGPLSETAEASGALRAPRGPHLHSKRRLQTAASGRPGRGRPRPRGLRGDAAPPRPGRTQHARVPPPPHTHTRLKEGGGTGPWRAIAPAGGSGYPQGRQPGRYLHGAVGLLTEAAGTAGVSHLTRQALPPEARERRGAPQAPEVPAGLGAPEVAAGLRAPEVPPDSQRPPETTERVDPTRRPLLHGQLVAHQTRGRPYRHGRDPTGALQE